LSILALLVLGSSTLLQNQHLNISIVANFLTTMAAAAAIEPAWTTTLFRPTNRLRDRHRERRGDDSYELNGFTEVELLPDLSPEHVLEIGITWEDFCRFLGRYTLVWMGPGVYAFAGYIDHPGYRSVVKLGSRKPRDRLLCVYAATGLETAAATTATCDFVVHLLATSKEDGARIVASPNTSVPISGPGISHFFQESHANLRSVTLENPALNEEQIGALATTESRPDMELILHACSLLDDNGCHAAFVECLHRDRGPTQLILCKIDCHILAAALEGNSRVTRLCESVIGDDAGKGVIFRSLAANKGLVELDLYSCSIIDENWTILCQSLKGHPTLTSLDLRDTNPRVLNGARIELSDEQRAQRTRVLAAMVQENRLLFTIYLMPYDVDAQIYEETILPYLETNLYRPRVLGIKKADIALRRPLLGLALQTKSVRKKSNLLWMFLSGNQDVVLQSHEGAPVEVAARAQEEVAASAPGEVVASAQEEGEGTPKRKR
jgi:hypothetical protein